MSQHTKAKRVTRRGFLKAAAGTVGAAAALPLLTTRTHGAGPKIKLRYGDWQLAEEPGGTAWRGLLADFEKANPDITIDAEPTPLSQYPAKIVTQSRAKQAPDVFRVYDPWVIAWADQGYLANLEPFIEKQGGADYKKDFYKPVVDVGSYKGAMYGLPSFSGSLLLQYNTTMFREAGLDPNKPPTTWPALLETAQKLTKKDASGRFVQWGYGMHGVNESSSIVRFLHWINNNGASVLNETNTASKLDSPEAIAALKFWSELYTVHGVVPPGPMDVAAGKARTLFAQEKIAMFQSIIWAADLVTTENPKIKGQFAFGLFPTQTGVDRSPQFMFYVGVNPNSANKEAAWRLADFMCSQAGQIKAYKIARFTPARRSVFESPDVQSDPFAKVAVKVANNVKPGPAIPQWNEIVNIIGDAMQQALTKAKTPADAFKAAHDRVNAVLKRG